jgi:hypothetical protein
MILLLGNSDDVLVRSVEGLLGSRGLPAQTVSESDLFSNVPFAFEQRGPTFGGSLWLDGHETQLDDVSGVLVRLPRVWSPPPDFDLQDQVFIYHECGAAWYALIAGLGCPAVNRPALCGWVQDLTYPETLACGLAKRLALPVAAPPAAAPGMGRTVPTRPPSAAHSISFYVVDGELIPRSADDKALADALALSTVGEWQQENGLRFCRLDFELHGRVLKLAQVEGYPLLEEEPSDVVERVATAITEVLA